MGYKIGDKVRVISNPNHRRRYHMEGTEVSDCMTPDMRILAGQVVTITASYSKYRIKEDGGMWNWTDQMFDCLVEEAEPQEDCSWEELF